MVAGWGENEVGWGTRRCETCLVGVKDKGPDVAMGLLLEDWNSLWSRYTGDYNKTLGFEVEDQWECKGSVASQDDYQGAIRDAGTNG